MERYNKLLYCNNFIYQFCKILLNEISQLRKGNDFLALDMTNISFLPLPLPSFLFLALAPFFARAKHRNSRFSDFLCSLTPRKRLLRRLFVSLLYKTNRFHAAVRLFSNRSQGYRLVCHFFFSYPILTSSVIYY